MRVALTLFVVALVGCTNSIVPEPSPAPVQSPEVAPAARSPEIAVASAARSEPAEPKDQDVPPAEDGPLLLFDILPECEAETAFGQPEYEKDLSAKIVEIEGEEDEEEGGLEWLLAKHGIDPNDETLDPATLPEEVQETLRRGAVLAQVIYARQNCLLNNRFDVEGAVVDQDGDPVPDVRMTVSRGILRIDPEFGPLVGTEKETVMLPDGRFRFIVEGGSRVGMRFADKPGYYPANAKVDVSMSEEERDRLGDAASEGTLPLEKGRVPLVRHGLRVVMHRIKRPTTLDSYFGTIRYSADGTGGAFVIGDSPNAVRLKAQVPVADFRRPDELPDRSLFLIPEVDEDGTIPQFLKRPNDDLADMYPKTFRLLLKDVDESSGLRLIDPRIEAPRDNDWGREAPADGYSREIVFDQETLTVSRNFFIQLDGRFGRGTFGRFRFKDEGRTIEADFGILLQPDGSRNLDALMEDIPLGITLW
ncbi:MAG: hypothetical protein WD066_04905 [Planctomycetaceae bacterium]